MKQTAAILLLCLLVFNTIGYRPVVQWMQQQQSSRLNQQLDAAAYDEDALIEITVPLSLPYYNNWSDWERHEGEIQLNGQTYQYVKRKVEGGQLLLKCLPNPQQQIIQKEVSSAFAQLNGFSATEKGTAKSVKQLVKTGSFDYEATAPLRFHPTTVAHNQQLAAAASPFFPSVLLRSPWQPPDAIS